MKFLARRLTILLSLPVTKKINIQAFIFGKIWIIYIYKNINKFSYLGIYLLRCLGLPDSSLWAVLPIAAAPLSRPLPSLLFFFVSLGGVCVCFVSFDFCWFALWVVLLGFLAVLPFGMMKGQEKEGTLLLFVWNPIFGIQRNQSLTKEWHLIFIQKIKSDLWKKRNWSLLFL